MDIKHFKLTNNEEIICEVVEWDSESSRDIVIRKALCIENKIQADNSYKYYTFSPWMAMQENLNSLQTLNSDLIISVATPSQTALAYFNDVVEEAAKINEEPEYLESDDSLAESDSSDTSMIVH
jgi:hypothetical protein